MKNRRRQYLVHWAGTAPEEDEWFNRRDLMDEYGDMIHDYEGKHGLIKKRGESGKDGSGRQSVQGESKAGSPPTDGEDWPGDGSGRSDHSKKRKKKKKKKKKKHRDDPDGSDYNSGHMTARTDVSDAYTERSGGTASVAGGQLTSRTDMTTAYAGTPPFQPPAKVFEYSRFSVPWPA